jgi:transcription antitermination factor NusA-like protein
MTRPVPTTVEQPPPVGVRLPGLDGPPLRPYGARSDDSVIVGDLLMKYVPALSAGELEIVAIARHHGILAKVAVRRRPGVRLRARPVSMMVGVGADLVNQVSAELGGERLHVLQWQGEPARYIAEALGLGYLPPIQLSPSSRLANVLLGDVDVRGTRGRRGINLLLASALTQWRIRLREISQSPAWKVLEQAQRERRTVRAIVQALVPKGLAVELYGLNGLLPIGQVRGVRRNTGAQHVEARLRERLGAELRVQVLRMDADAGHIYVSEQVPSGRQLLLPFAHTL